MYKNKILHSRIVVEQDVDHENSQGQFYSVDVLSANNMGFSCEKRFKFAATRCH